MSAPMEQIEAKLRTFIAEEILFSRDGFTYPDHASFLETGIVDSMSIMEIVLFAQETFGVDIEDREITPDNFDSVAKIAAFLRRKASNGSD